MPIRLAASDTVIFLDLLARRSVTPDALVGAAAKEHGIPLGTRDRRAAHTYQVLELDVEFVGGLGS